MNDEALEIESFAAQTTSDESVEIGTDISVDIPLADNESEISDTDVEETDAPSDGQDGGALEGSDERTALRAELDKLRADLDGISSKRAEFISEIREFSTIFGADAVCKIPDEVWESTNRGIPLAAAYALYEKKESQRREMIERINQKNSSMSAGAIKNATNPEFFSHSEVKAMSAKEVKKNYNRIIESMKKWN